MPAPRALLIIVNPTAGNGRAEQLGPRVAAILGEQDIPARLIETREPGHAERMAASATDLGHDRVVVVGGDGTVQEVLNGLVAGRIGPTGGAPELGIVPSGSGNDLARSLGLPMGVADALAVAQGERTQPLDVGRAAGAEGRVRHFGAAGGVGFDAQVAWAMAGRPYGWQRGRLGYVLQTLNELRRYRNRELRVTLLSDDGERRVDGPHLFVAFANGAYYGGGMRICPEADPADGWLDVCLAGNIGRLGALRELPGIYRAAHVANPHVTIVRVRALRIEGEAYARAHLDGEPFGTVPLDVSLVPGAVRVAVGGSATVSG